MTPRRLVISLAAAAALLGGATATATATAARPAAHLLVYAQEWSLWPSRTSVPAGRVSVQLWNRGQDAHDLRIRRLRGRAMTGAAQGAQTTTAGQISTASWHLSPGTYELYCSMPGHMKMGMHAKLTVR